MIGVVMRKELTDHWRDRRSVLGALILPVMGPLLLLVVFAFISDIKKDRPLELPVVGAERAPELIEFLETNGVVVEEPPADPEGAIIDGDSLVVLRIGEDYAERFATTRGAPVDVLVDRSNAKAHRSVLTLQRLLSTYDRRLASQRLILRGIAPVVAQPLAVSEVDLASPQRIAAKALGIIPLLLLLAALMGGMNIAIDTTAGERERDSLEPLLLNPISRFELLLGKWAATSIFALAVIALSMLGFIAAVAYAPTEDLGMMVVFGLPDAAMMFAALAPLALLGAATQMLVATFARTFKEAQTYLNIFNMLPTIPALFLMMNPTSTELWMMAVPTVAQFTAITDVLRGDEVSALSIALIWASSALFCAACLAALNRMFQREKTIFGR